MDKLELSGLLKEIRRFEKMPPPVNGLKIAVLGSFSTQYFVKMLRYYLAENGLQCQIYEGEYNSINMEAFNPNSEIYVFSPDYIILLPYYSDIRHFPALLAASPEIDSCLEAAADYYKNLWEKLNTIDNVKILQSNIVIPPMRSLGNLEYQVESAACNFLRKVNNEFVRNKPSYVTIIDADDLSCNMGKYNWFDFPAYFLNKAGVCLLYMPEFVRLFVLQIKAHQGNTKKCLVLDLDNTLWGGAAGDDGWDGIQLDPNHPLGEAFLFFQRYVLALKERGVILAVCSKNEEAIAKEPFEKNENMILHLDDISCFVANWNDKASNLKYIAEELNIGTDSLVFFDDNPAERAIVKKYLPEAYVVDVPRDPAMYVVQLEKESPFEWLQLTKEDLARTKSYKDNRQRKALKDSFVDYDEYLKALEMKGSVDLLQENDIERFTQLINKSNQFNLRTIRYSEAEIQKMAGDDNTRCLFAKLRDKYSNYGIISCVILKKKGNECFIDTWVMSCRVLNRGVEHMMLEAVFRNAAGMECSAVKAEYRKTKKNAIVEKFYDLMGFQECKAYENNGVFIKEYKIDDLENIQKYYIEEDTGNE